MIAVPGEPLHANSNESPRTPAAEKSETFVRCVSGEDDQAQCSQNEPAFIDALTHRRLTFPALKDDATALSTCLSRNFNIQAGDTVSIFANNVLEYAICMFAIVRLGARASGAPPAFTVPEMTSALATTAAKMIFCVPSSLERCIEAATAVGIPRERVVLMFGDVNVPMATTNALKGESVGPTSTVSQLVNAGKASIVTGGGPAPYYTIPAGQTNRDVCGYLNFSSGTTGRPKAVMISHHNVIAQCYQSRQIQVDPDTVKVLAVMPLYHVTGTWRFLHYPLFLNTSSVLLPTYSLPNLLTAITTYRLTEAVLVPPILLRLARDPLVLAHHEKYDLSCVQRWTSGAAPISQEVLRDLHARFPWTGFRQGYGATEAPCTAAMPPEMNDWRWAGSVGMLLGNTEAKVMSLTTDDGPDDERELGVGEVGELWVRGPQVASLGYLGEETATQTSFNEDGFYRTGDVGWIDANGLIYITDRIKEMIKVKGHQVPPAELEDLLLGHGLVSDCCVVGIDGGEYDGEVPKAFVVLKPMPAAAEGREDSTEAEALKEYESNACRLLIEYVKSKTIRYKWLKEIEVVKTIPKSPAGKLLRRVLRDKEREKERERKRNADCEQHEKKVEEWRSNDVVNAKPSGMALPTMTALIVQ